MIKSKSSCLSKILLETIPLVMDRCKSTNCSKAHRGSFLLFEFRVCLYNTVLYVPYSLVVTCWEKADLLALLCIMFSCVFFLQLPICVLGQVWYLIVSIPDLCLLPYFGIRGIDFIR